MAEASKPVIRENLGLDEKVDEQTNGSFGGNSAAISSLEEERRLDRAIRWKRDLVLVPVMGTMYVLLFLDRTNIANARSLGIGKFDGLEMSLHMPADGYNTALWIFYIPFMLAEVPANLILGSGKIRPGTFLGGQMFILGVLGMCQGLTRSYGGLLALRFLLGVFESALPAGAIYMLSTYYTRREAAIRFAWFFNFALAGPLFSGLLAYALETTLDGASGYPGWRWIFVVEGLATCVAAAFVARLCPNFPQHAQPWYLSARERDRLLRRLEVSRGGREAKGSAADGVPIWKVLVDWRIHLLTACFFCCDVTASSLSSFAPTILAELGWTTATVAQLMTMPVWAAGIASTFFITWLTSETNLRAPFLLFSVVLQLVGWSIMVAYVPTAGVRYLALFFMATGTYPQMAILTGWLSANLRGRKYLAVGMGWMVGFGNCANFVSSNVFISAESPRYRTGFATGLAFTILGFVLTSGAFVLLYMGNRRRDKIRAKMTDAQREDYDALHFEFVY
ncbi:MFS general substrate transporter [Hypoxylon sp. FL1150]|nr:MFS general substrate transporter [Hypoxylon sp. FL1150]